MDCGFCGWVGRCVCLYVWDVNATLLSGQEPHHCCCQHSNGNAADEGILIEFDINIHEDASSHSHWLLRCETSLFFLIFHLHSPFGWQIFGTLFSPLHLLLFFFSFRALIRVLFLIFYLIRLLFRSLVVDAIDATRSPMFFVCYNIYANFNYIVKLIKSYKKLFLLSKNFSVVVVPFCRASICVCPSVCVRGRHKQARQSVCIIQSNRATCVMERHWFNTECNGCNGVFVLNFTVFFLVAVKLFPSCILWRHISKWCK